MSCSKQSCEGCTCSNTTSQPIQIEDCMAELNALRRRNQELETRLNVTNNQHKTPITPTKTPGRTLRSSAWFDCASDPGMTAIYMERYFNFGITREELMSGKPMIGIAQSGSDIAPCNRHHIELAKRVREGIRTAGGIAIEFPTHPIQETSRRPTATLDRNLAYLGLVEVLTGYFLDGVVLLTGCDKTTPACLMAAATVVSCCFLGWERCVLLIGVEYSGYLYECWAYVEWVFEGGVDWFWDGSLEGSGDVCDG
jgi:dihydroxy-acid dehydratase